MKARRIKIEDKSLLLKSSSEIAARTWKKQVQRSGPHNFSCRVLDLLVIYGAPLVLSD